MVQRPEIVEDKHLTYLDKLQKSGVTNMFGAAEYIQLTFGVDRKESKTILSYWMHSYEEQHPEN